MNITLEYVSADSVGYSIHGNQTNVSCSGYLTKIGIYIVRHANTLGTIV